MTDPKPQPPDTAPRALPEAIALYAADQRRQRMEREVAALIDRLKRNLAHVDVAGHA